MRILLTGAGRGIGRAAALAFAKPGIRIALCARSEAQLNEVADQVRQLGAEAHVIPIDLLDSQSIAPAVERAIACLGNRLDILVNNAGSFDVAPIGSMSLEFWQATLALNLTAPMLLTQACLPSLIESPSATIINVLSIAAENGYPGNAAYCASKYGLRGFSDALRAELRDQTIRVRSVFPKGTNTAIFEGVDGDWDLDAMDAPEQVAQLIVAASQANAPNELRMYE